MPNYKITVQYDGTNLVGWQRQDNGISIQALLEEAAQKFLQEKVNIIGAGRTDGGVHALGQVANFITTKNLPTETICRAFNFYLRPHKIAVIKAEAVNEEFNARFSAKARHYLYRIALTKNTPIFCLNQVWQVKQNLILAKMQLAAAHLVGRHDFTSFRAKACLASSAMITLDKLAIEQVVNVNYGYEEIHFWLKARSFLHHMVRNIVGSLVLIGKNYWQVEDLLIALKAQDRAKAGPTAPASGLYLTKIDY